MREGDPGLIPIVCRVCAARVWRSKVADIGTIELDGSDACWDCYARSFTGGREVRALYVDLSGAEFGARVFDIVAQGCLYFVGYRDGRYEMLPPEIFRARFL